MKPKILCVLNMPGRPDQLNRYYLLEGPHPMEIFNKSMLTLELREKYQDEIALLTAAYVLGQDVKLNECLQITDYSEDIWYYVPHKE